MDRSDQWTETRLAVTDHSRYACQVTVVTFRRGFLDERRIPIRKHKYRLEGRVPAVDLVGYALKLGTIGFGGPRACGLYAPRSGRTTEVDQRGRIQGRAGSGRSSCRDRWPHSWRSISDSFTTALGATLVGVAFVLPSFLMVLPLGWAYVEYGGISWMQAVFYGVGAAVIGIITCRLQLDSENHWQELAAGAFIWLRRRHNHHGVREYLVVSGSRRDGGPSGYGPAKPIPRPRWPVSLPRF